jgi:GNAT superfamily N-acetyltransferase
MLNDHVGAWFRLSFGAQQAHGIKAVEVGEWPPGARRAAPGDLDAVLELAPVVSDHHGLAPVFSGIEWDEDPDELRAMLAADLADDAVGELVYERDGRIVAGFELVSAERATMHGGPARPDAAACIGWAATRPDVRGSGAGLALMAAASAWAHEQGYASLVTDWRETNLLASRFWPARGFRRSFLRLYRSIP